MKCTRFGCRENKNFINFFIRTTIKIENWSLNCRNKPSRLILVINCTCNCVTSWLIFKTSEWNIFRNPKVHPYVLKQNVITIRPWMSLIFSHCKLLLLWLVVLMNCIFRVVQARIFLTMVPTRRNVKSEHRIAKQASEVIKFLINVHPVVYLRNSCVFCHAKCLSVVKWDTFNRSVELLFILLLMMANAVVLILLNWVSMMIIYLYPQFWRVIFIFRSYLCFLWFILWLYICHKQYRVHYSLQELELIIHIPKQKDVTWGMPVYKQDQVVAKAKGFTLLRYLIMSVCYREPS